jgi:hypothetical protein
MMKRQITGVVAATIAAAYLTAFLIQTFALLFSEQAGRGIADLFGLIVLGTIALILYGIPVFLISGMLAFALRGLSQARPWYAVMSGGVLGLCFMSYKFSDAIDGFWFYAASGLIAGAISGWIYWRIAFGGKISPAETRTAHEHRCMIGAVVANLAGPCIVALYFFLLTVLTRPSHIPASDEASVLSAYAAFLLKSWAGMVIEIFPASLLFAWLGWRSRWRSVWIYVAAGAAVSTVLSAAFQLLIVGPGEQSLANFAYPASLGAICGWIYWRIAFMERLPPTHALPSPEQHP